MITRIVHLPETVKITRAMLAVREQKHAKRARVRTVVKRYIDENGPRSRSRWISVYWKAMREDGTNEVKGVGPVTVSIGSTPVCSRIHGTPGTCSGRCRTVDSDDCGSN